MEPTLLTSESLGTKPRGEGDLALGSWPLASRHWGLICGWMLLLFVLVLLWWLRSIFEPLWWMWLVAFTIFFGFKFLTLLSLDGTVWRRLSPGRSTAYLFLWPGLRPDVFAEGVCEKRNR